MLDEKDVVEEEEEEEEEEDLEDLEDLARFLLWFVVTVVTICAVARLRFLSCPFFNLFNSYHRLRTQASWRPSCWPVPVCHWSRHN